MSNSHVRDGCFEYGGEYGRRPAQLCLLQAPPDMASHAEQRTPLCRNKRPRFGMFAPLATFAPGTTLGVAMQRAKSSTAKRPTVSLTRPPFTRSTVRLAPSGQPGWRLGDHCYWPGAQVQGLRHRKPAPCSTPWRLCSRTRLLIRAVYHPFLYFYLGVQLIQFYT